MILDVSLLTYRHGLLILIHVIAVFLALLGILKRRRTKPPVYRAGGVIIASIVGGSMYVLGASLAWMGLVLAAALVLFVGTLDESRPLKPLPQLGAQLGAAAIAVSSGWTIRYVSMISGEGVLRLDWVSLGPWVFPGSIAAVLWLVLLMNALNLLDGVDGLAASVSGVTFLALAAVSMLPQIHDRATLELAVVGVGTLVGFLVWNWPPAKVYLGTSGSWLLGLYLGMVAIMSGGKVVTTMLVFSLPVLDAIFVIVQRLLAGQPPWKGDRRYHLHHRLLKAGLTPRAVTLLMALVTTILAAVAILLPTRQKIGVFAAVGIAAAIVVIVLASQQERIHEHE